MLTGKLPYGGQIANARTRSQFNGLVYRPASHGDRDFAMAAMQDIGLDLAFAGVRIKPGKPVWYGKVNGKHVVGLPGNPTAAMTVSRLFLAPLLVALQGRPWASGLQWKECPTLRAIARNGEREAFLCANDSGAGVHLLDGQNASDQARLALANSLVRLPPFAPAVPAGGIVQSLSF